MDNADFDINRSRWWNVSGVDRTTQWLCDSAESLMTYARNLSKFERDDEIDAKMAKAESALNDSLLAVKLARSGYLKATEPKHLEAAE